MPIYDNPMLNTQTPWMTNSGVGQPTNILDDSYGPQRNGGMGLSANSQQLRAQAQQQAIARRNAAIANGTYQPSTVPSYANTYEAAFNRPNGTINPNQGGGWTNPNQGGGWTNPNPTDYASLMSGLNSLNPGDINIDSTASMFTNTILSDYGQNQANALNYLQQSGQAGVEGYQGILNTLQGGVSEYLRNINQGAQAESAGISGTLGYYQTRANQNQLPGQNIMEQNIQANTAGALNKVREYGGGSQGALGAITNLYGQQQAGMRDIGLGAANYQAQNQANLGNYMGTIGAQRAGISNRLGEAAMSGAQTTATGQQMLTQAQQSASGNVSDYYQNLAPQSANLLSGLMQQRLNAEQQQADLARRSVLDVSATMGAGLQAQTTAQDQSYLYNQIMPQQNYQNYLSGIMGIDTGSGALLDSAQNQANSAQDAYYQQQQIRAQLLAQLGQSVGNLPGLFAGGMTQSGGQYNYNSGY